MGKIPAKQLKIQRITINTTYRVFSPFSDKNFLNHFARRKIILILSHQQAKSNLSDLISISRNPKNALCLQQYVPVHPGI